MDSPPRRDVSERDVSERAVPAEFETFEISIQRIDEIYRASVTTSPVAETRPIKIDPSGLTLEPAATHDSSEDTRDVERQGVDRNDLRTQGERLFRTVFVGEVVAAYRGATEHARGRGKGLRICLKLDEAAELSVLPWEALWDPESKVFLADQPDLPIVRTLRATSRVAPPPVSEGALRMLALLPEPLDQSKLNSAEEWKQIRDQLAGLVEAGRLAADPIEPPTLDTLRDAIDAGPCHILHIVAHGGAGGDGDGGSLLLQTPRGRVDEVTGDTLAWALAKRDPPRLVLINACHGARAAADDAFDGLAQRLINRGVTAVVAMRTVISNPAAVAFAAAFYRQLAEGHTVEASVVEARRTLALGEHRVEWATPALYTRAANVRIFEGAAMAPLPLMASAASPQRRAWLRPLVALLAILLGALVWRAMAPEPEPPPSLPTTESLPSKADDRCPAPLGLTDLEFVYIDPDVVDTGERKIIVDAPFCIATKEVSRRDWQTVMGGELKREGWAPDWPMTDVAFADAEAFLTQLSVRETGVSYRLPTADEWEFAARAESETRFIFGNEPTELHRYGNCKNILEQDGFDGPAPVGTYRPNAWGLYDVHGNVAEWVQWPEGEEPSQDDEGNRLALRLGGSFESATSSCAFAHRSIVQAASTSRQETGFRIVRDVVSAEEEE